MNDEDRASYPTPRIFAFAESLDGRYRDWVPVRRLLFADDVLVIVNAEQLSAPLRSELAEAFESGSRFHKLLDSLDASNEPYAVFRKDPDGWALSASNHAYEETLPDSGNVRVVFLTQKRPLKAPAWFTTLKTAFPPERLRNLLYLLSDGPLALPSETGASTSTSGWQPSKLTYGLLGTFCVVSLAMQGTALWMNVRSAQSDPVQRIAPAPRLPLHDSPLQETSKDDTESAPTITETLPEGTPTASHLD